MFKNFSQRHAELRLHVLEHRYFKDVAEVTYCVLTLSNHNFIRGEIKKRLNSGNS
jgi:hypothetical protein